MRQEGPRQRHKCRELNRVALNLPTTQQRMGSGHIKFWGKWKQFGESMLNMSCLMWAKFTHSILGYYDDALWCLCAEIAERKLVEMKGRVNLSQ